MKRLMSRLMSGSILFVTACSGQTYEISSRAETTSGAPSDAQGPEIASSGSEAVSGLPSSAGAMAGAGTDAGRVVADSVFGGVLSLTGLGSPGTQDAASSAPVAVVGFEFGSRTCDPSGNACIVGGLSP